MKFYISVNQVSLKISETKTRFAFIKSFTTIEIAKEYWLVPVKTVRYRVGLVLLNSSTISRIYEMFEFARNQTFGSIKDIY